VALAAAGHAGCQKAHVVTPEPLNPTPIVEDEAMRLRQWPTVSAMYPSGVVPAGPTLFAREPRRDMETWRYLYADPATFSGNLLLMPYQFYRTPPWTEVYYRGAWVLPSYTAVPALPPELPQVAQLEPAAGFPAPPTVAEPPRAEVPVVPSTQPTP
jgi:hypothetical protein